MDARLHVTDVVTQIKRLIGETAHLPDVEEKNIRLEELKIKDGKGKWTSCPDVY